METKILEQKGDVEGDRFKRLHPGYAPLKIDYQNRTCLLGDAPLEVGKHYDIVSTKPVVQFDHYCGSCWENVYVEREEGGLTPTFVSNIPFERSPRTIILRGKDGAKFFMKPNDEMNKLEEDCRRLSEELTLKFMDESCGLLEK
jgi:hypothetical protein